MGVRRVAWLAVLAAVGTLVVVVPAAQADPPSNDDVDDALVIPALAFDHDVDLTEATVEPAEPDCYSYVYVGSPPEAQSSASVADARRWNPRALGLKTSHEEPSRVTTNTVWYSYTPSSAERLTVDTLASEPGQDTMLAVYTRDEFGAYQLVTCNDDASYDLHSRVIFDAEADREYLIQLGAWYGQATSAHLHMQVAPPPGQLSGRVTDDATGAPIADVCVEAIEGAGPYWSWAFTTTQADGTYSLTLDPGQFQVGFFDCDIAPEDDTYHRSEYYDDAEYSYDATLVTIDPAVETSGIDAGLELLQGNPWAPADVAITSLEVERVMLQVDGATAPVSPGTNRIVHVELANLGRGDGFGVLDVEICPVSGTVRCSYLEPQEYELLADDTARISLRWNGTGTFGDVEIRATAESCTDESDWENNTLTTTDYVTLGGTGMGVGVARGSRSFYCWGTVGG